MNPVITPTVAGGIFSATFCAMTGHASSSTEASPNSELVSMPRSQDSYCRRDATVSACE